MIIAQVTDTHIKKNSKLAYKQVDTQMALRKCIKHINRLNPKPDIVVFTGDNVDFGDEEEYILFKSIIEKLDMPFYILPGNHDLNENLKKVFYEQPWDNDSNFLNFFLDNFPIQIIGIDSSIPKTNYGQLCEKRLSWLEQELIKANNKKTLIFMHHPPIKVGIHHIDIQNLKNGSKELGKLIRQYQNVVGIACGHVHRTSFTLWNNTIVSTAPSPSHQVVLDFNKNSTPSFVIEPPSIHLHYWQEDTGLTTHVSLIDKFEGPFPFYDEQGNLID